MFVVRLNAGVFPHIRSFAENGYKGLEEERRLAYVAMTRAKKLLYLTFAGDYSYVLQGNLLPSQFLKESGNEVVVKQDYNPFKSNRPRPTYHFDDGPNDSFQMDEPSRPVISQVDNGINDWKVGDTVIHKTFGEGTVVALDGDGIIKVNFKEHGTKTLMGNHPSLSKGGQK